MPGRFEVPELPGQVYSAESHDEKATAPLQRAVRLRPESGPARNSPATNLARLGKALLAEKEFQQGVELEPPASMPIAIWVHFTCKPEELRPRYPMLEKARSADPTAYDNGYDLAPAYEKAGRLPEAPRQVEEILKQKDTAELHNLLADVEEKAGNYVAAVNEYETAAPGREDTWRPLRPTWIRLSPY